MTSSPDISLEELFALTNSTPKSGIGHIRVSRTSTAPARRDKFLDRRTMPTITRIEDGAADCVIVYNVSRWGRSSIKNQLSEGGAVGGRGTAAPSDRADDEKPPLVVERAPGELGDGLEPD
jgi:hypothetical protein